MEDEAKAEEFLSIDDELEELPTDEAEEISPEEAASTDIPLVQGPAEEDHLASLVCESCQELNLTTKSIITCARCGKPFCFHFASSVDPMYCVNCLSDVSMEKSIITKTYKHENAEGVQTFYRRKAREIKIGGTDWLFAQRKIYELSDVELDLMIEYHRNILALMIDEQTQQRIAKLHRYAGVEVHIKTPSTTDVAHTTTTTTKRTRTVSKNKQSEQLAALLKQMQHKGMSINDIAKAIKH